MKNRPALGDSKSNIGKNLMTCHNLRSGMAETYQDQNGEYSNWNGMDPYNVNPYWDVYKNFERVEERPVPSHGQGMEHGTSQTLKVQERWEPIWIGSCSMISKHLRLRDWSWKNAKTAISGTVCTTRNTGSYNNNMGWFRFQRYIRR